MNYREILDHFADLTSNPQKAQEETLFRLLKSMSSSAYGKHYRFDEIKDVETFKKRVPLVTYEDLRPWLEKDPAALTGERPSMWMQTSGSTNKQKMLPDTPLFDHWAKVAHDVFTAALFEKYPWLPMKKGETPSALGLYQLNTEKGEFNGVPLGYYTQRLFQISMEEDPFFRALPQEVYQISDAKKRLYAMALCGAPWKIRAIRGTNPTTVLLFARMLGERTHEFISDLESGRVAGSAELSKMLAPYIIPQPVIAQRLRSLDRPITPRDIWPELELLITWKGGTYHMYEHFYEKYFGKVDLWAPNYATTEGPVALVMDEIMYGGVPALESSYFEFISEDDPEAPTVSLEQLEQGKVYELIFTSSTGVVRYRIGDLIKVEGMYGHTPMITFVGRKGKTCSLTGEKLAEQHVDEAVNAAVNQLGVVPMHYALCGEYDEVPYYVLSMELSSGSQEEALKFARLVDTELINRNIEYKAKRDSHRLFPIVPHLTAPGEFEHLHEKGLTAEKPFYKLPHLSRDPMHKSLKGLSGRPYEK